MTAQYPVLPIAAGTLARALAGSLSLATRAVNNVARALRNRREATMLAGLDRHMLADIGLTRSDVQDAFSEPLWQDPTALLKERARERRINRPVKRSTQWAGAESGFTQPATNRAARHTV